MPALSPRTQSFSGGQSPEQAKAMFDQGLTEMAYNVFLAKFPSLAPHVVTLKVLHTDSEAGSGVAAFILRYGSQTLYVPVVMVDSALKPLDVLYSKDLNVFTPLSLDWISLLQSRMQGQLGEGATPPESMATDVDLRSLVVPPATGRYSYAEERELEKFAGRPFDEARAQAATPPFFLEWLRHAPNTVKKACVKLFERNVGTLKAAAWFHTVPALTDAMRLNAEKVAAEKVQPFALLDDTASEEEIRNAFGSSAPVAYSKIRTKGYAVKDERKNVNRAVQLQPFAKLTEPKEGGLYRLWKSDGTPVVALVTAKPASVFPEEYVHTFGPRKPRIGGGFAQREEARYVGITADGTAIDVLGHMLAAELPEHQLADASALKRVLEGRDAPSPRVGEKGLFIKKAGSSWRLTKFYEVKAVSSPNTGVKHVTLEPALGGWECLPSITAVIDSNKGGGSILTSLNSQLAHVPKDYVWVPVNDKETLRHKAFLARENDILHYTTEKAVNAGAFKVKVAAMDNGGFMVGSTCHSRVTDAIRDIAKHANVEVSDAAYAVEQADKHGSYSFWSLKKLAQDPMQGQPMQGDPAGMAMDGVSAQMAPPPPQPSPVDMAVAEQMKNLQAQMGALQQMQMLVQNIQQRAGEIAAGGGAAGDPAAAAAMYAGGDAAMAPVDPAMGGQPMQGDPNAQMQGDPAMMQQQGMDPSMMPNGAMMDGEAVDPATVAQQVNPAYAEAAAGLNDAGIFDATLLASMAQMPSLRNAVQQYLPTMEKSLDNLGRVLLSIWMDEVQLRTELGTDAFIKLEDSARTTFRGLGDMLLRLAREAQLLGRTPQQRN